MRAWIAMLVRLVAWVAVWFAIIPPAVTLPSCVSGSEVPMILARLTLDFLLRHAEHALSINVRF